jgi:hypothetical protein
MALKFPVLGLSSEEDTMLENLPLACGIPPLQGVVELPSTVKPARKRQSGRGWRLS